MTEPMVNPFDPESFAQGGGLWDGKVVTITSAAAKTEALKHKDGSTVLDDITKQPVIQTALCLKGIADGEDKERHEEYSAGDKLVALADGEGFVSKDGGPVRFHANSNIAKLAGALKGAGFDLGTLVENGKQKLSGLIGVRLLMKAEAKLGRDGKPLKDKKGFTKNIHLPVRFVGTAAAHGEAAVPPPMGGDAGKKAGAAMLAALAKGPLTRADLVRTLATQLAGDTDANAVIALVVRDDFHAGKPWKYDGTKASL